MKKIPLDILDGLKKYPPELPCRLLYDEAGALLFSAICLQPDYYLPRAEKRLMDQHLPAIAARLGPYRTVIEPGVGDGTKAERLLASLQEPAAFIGVDVAGPTIKRAGVQLSRRFPELNIHMLEADFGQLTSLPELSSTSQPLLFFPGSTLGNFQPREAGNLLRRFSQLAGSGGQLLIGVDPGQHHAHLLRAYDDSAGVTAAFNRNILIHLKQAYGIRIDPRHFEHRAVWLEDPPRIEMHLVAQIGMHIVVADQTIEIKAGEHLHTESSHKYPADIFVQLIKEAGLRIESDWRDSEGDFVWYLLACA